MESEQAHRKSPWLIGTALLTVALIVFVALFAWVNRHLFTGQPSANGRAPTGVPDLGSKGRPMIPLANNPAEEPASNTPADGTTIEPEPPKELLASEREIDIHIKNLKFAVQRNNARARSLESDWLKAAKPRELVNARLATFWELEPDATVRLAFFDCTAEQSAALELALKALRGRNAKYAGTDSTFDQGEERELGVYLVALLSAGEAGSAARPVATHFLQTREPKWLGEPVFEGLLKLVLGAGQREALAWCWPDLETCAKSRPAGDNDPRVVWLWLTRFKDMASLAGALAQQEFSHLLPDVLAMFSIIPGRYDRYAENEPFKSLLGGSAGVFDLCEQLLASGASADIKRRALHFLTQTILREDKRVYAMIQAGVERRDASLPYFLEALGAIASAPNDIKRLTEFAGDSNAEVARGAINGLRQSPIQAADIALRDILDHGTNSGVKADALAALLERNADIRGRLVEEYLGEDKAVSLRIISVSYLTEKNLDKLKSLGESDPELRVREAAINKLGSFKNNGLKTWFKRVSRDDASPVLRQLAKKYAAELE